MEGSASLTPNQPEGLDKWIESSVWGSLPLTRKAPYKVKNRRHPAMDRVAESSMMAHRRHAGIATPNGSI
jgi:hypothetical protein